VSLVRGWTTVYTLGLATEDRARRQQEIESDVWESLNDPDAAPHSLTLLARLIAGIPDDLGWRVEQPAPARPLMFAVVFGGVCTLVLMALIAWAGTAAPLPRPEPLIRLQSDQRPPPPPPPPPPRPDSSKAVR
jgi:hypothetical protein